MSGRERIQTGMFIVLSIWILVQIVLIILFWGKPQGSDQGVYMKMAYECLEAGNWYPNINSIYSYYIWAPGLINFFILQLKLFGTLNLNVIFNLLMNIGIAWEIYYLGKYFFDKRTAYLAVIFWCLLYSNLMIVIPAGTEIPFLFLALGGFCLCLSRRYMLFILAGVSFALANWIRPLVIIFLFSILFYMFLKKYNWKEYVLLLFPLLLITFLIGKSTEKTMGYFVYQSTTSGANLIMTANDKAYGGVATSIFSDSTNLAYIENVSQYTFVERDSIWKARAIDWIKANPIKYTYLYLKKIGGLYIEDSWSDRPILGGDGFIDSYVVEGKISKIAFVKRLVWMGLKSLVYYFIMGIFLYSVVIFRKEWFSQKGILLFLLFIGTASTCLFSVSPRYHYPFLFIPVLFSAYGFIHFIDSKKGMTERLDIKSI